MPQSFPGPGRRPGARRLAPSLPHRFCRSQWAPAPGRYGPPGRPASSGAGRASGSSPCARTRPRSVPGDRRQRWRNPAGQSGPAGVLGAAAVVRLCREPLLRLTVGPRRWTGRRGDSKLRPQGFGPASSPVLQRCRASMGDQGQGRREGIGFGGRLVAAPAADAGKAHRQPAAVAA